MSVYSIDFSEPLTTGFSIPAGGFNGPGGAASATSLRLYGRGALDWGEAVNEDLVRLTENFASASPPRNPIGGQLWAETKLYHYDGTTWSRYDPDGVAWAVMTAPDVVSALPITGTLGTYCLFNGTLYGFYKKSPEPTASWIPRSYSTGTQPAKPVQTLKVYDAFYDVWVPPQSVNVTGVVPPNPLPGTIWFNTVTGDLSVFDGTTWSVIKTGTAVTSNLDMLGQFRISNLINPPLSDLDAASKKYVDDAPFVSLSGDTMTGSLILNADPTTSLGATTKQYVDTAIAAGVGSAATVFSGAGPFNYNAGAIAVSGGKIYIALAAGYSTAPGGNWRQVWPATYS